MCAKTAVPRINRTASLLIMPDKPSTGVNMSETSTAYFAGLFDGEGHVSVQRNGSSQRDGTRYWRYALRIGIANTHRGVIGAFAEWAGVGCTMGENWSNPR